MAEQHIIEITAEGEITIAVKGVKGRACKDATAQIEKLLGKTTKDVPTEEMNHVTGVQAGH